MRDPDRIDRIVEILRSYWKTPGNEDLRLAQIVCNLSDHDDPYCFEDDSLEIKLSQAISVAERTKK